MYRCIAGPNVSRVVACLRYTAPISPYNRSIKTLVFSKGVGVFGALGNGSDLTDRPHYSIIESMNGLDIQAVTVAMGHSAVLVSGRLLLFGRPYEITNLLRINRFRILSPALARFVNRTSASPLFGDLLLEPSAVDLPSVISHRSIGGLNVMLTADGQVFNLGSHRWDSTTASFGRSDVDAVALVKCPQSVPLPCAATHVDIGMQHCVARTCDALVYAWGAGERGQLGDGRAITSSIPVMVALPGDAKALDVKAGFQFSCVLSEDGSVFVWGKFMSNKLRPSKVPPGTYYCISVFRGHYAISLLSIHVDDPSFLGIYEDQMEPRQVKLPNNRKIIEICSWCDHICIMFMHL
jgi:Regulator of chromosome condensation (RCC1) repeat